MKVIRLIIFITIVFAAFFLHAQLVAPGEYIQSAAIASANSPVFPGGDSPFYLYVEKGSFSITVFYKDSDGNYSIPLRTFPTAIGRSSRMTPIGIFQKSGTELWHNWGSSYSPYTSEYTANLYLHGPLYRNMSFDSLSPNSASQIGAAVSSGCLRTTAEAAYFFYEHCPAGTIVHIVDGSPYGYNAPAPVVAEQYRDPSGMTLGEIFPDFAYFFYDAYNTGTSGGKYDTLWDEYAHYAWQKKDAYPGMYVEIDKASLEMVYRSNGGSDGEAGAGAGASQVEKLNAFLVFGNNPDNAYRIESNALLWISSDVSVITVDPSGWVYCAGPGRAYVIVLGPDGMSAAVCSVTVSYNPGPQRAGGSPAGAFRQESPQDKENFRVVAEETFPDLTQAHWAAEAVGRLKQSGVVEGSGKRFGPDDDITKTEFLKMLVLTVRINRESEGAAANLAAPVSGNDYTGTGADADGKQDSQWFMPYLIEAEAFGILSGDERRDISLSPDEFLTREEFCLWIGKAFGFRLSSPDIYPDGELFIHSQTARRLVSRRFINSFADGSFRPDAFVTRAVASQTISNLIKGGFGNQK